MTWILCLLLVGARAVQAGDTLETTFQKASAALAAGDYTRAEQGFLEVLKSAPAHVGALGNLGVVYSRTNRTAKAIEIYGQALRLTPHDQGLLLDLGLVYLKEDRRADALPLFTQALRENSSNRQLRELAATCELYTGQVTQAVTELEKLRQEDPREPGASYLVGIGYLKLRQDEKAQKVLEEFLSNLASPLQSNLLLGKAYYDATFFTKAAECFEKVLSLDPHFPGAHLELAKTFVSLRRNPEAEVQFLRALEEDAQDPQAHYFLGALLVEENRFPEAQRQLLEARYLKPDFWGTYFYLGKLELEMKNATEAIPLLEKAARLNPREPSSYFLLARALKLSGRDAESERALELFRQRKRAQAGAVAGSPR